MGCINDTGNSGTPVYIKCQKCSQNIHRANFTYHVCSNQVNPMQLTPKPKIFTNRLSPILFPSFSSPPSPYDFELYGNQIHSKHDENISVKIPVNSQRTLFKWTNYKVHVYPPSIKDVGIQKIKTRSFQQKLQWFRYKVESLRIPWENGCEVIRVSRGNILMSCYDQMKKTNFHKEVKIDFDDQSVEDAGGLLREWIHLALKEIFSIQMGIFQLCDTYETAYKIKWDKDVFQELYLQYMWVLGVLIGKSIFERVSLDCRLNKTILRQLCSQPVHLNDVFSFDKKLYSSWKTILESPTIENLFLVFSEIKVHEDGSPEEINLLEDENRQGTDVQVNNQNKNNYISELVNLYCTKSIKKYLEQIKTGIGYTIPLQYLKIFEPHQFEMLMSGPHQIDIVDWRKNTEYTAGYSADDEIIQFFWDLVEGFDQEKLSNLLHYCTGSTRVPIFGFKYLQSNRNTVSRFTIQKTKYSQANPYPKGHTCFNRLQLPEYNDLQEMQERFNTILKQEMNHFGLD